MLSNGCAFQTYTKISDKYAIMGSVSQIAKNWQGRCTMTVSFGKTYFEKVIQIWFNIPYAKRRSL
jgi:hypothetical protein